MVQFLNHHSYYFSDIQVHWKVLHFYPFSFFLSFCFLVIINVFTRYCQITVIKGMFGSRRCAPLGVVGSQLR